MSTRSTATPMSEFKYLDYHAADGLLTVTLKRPPCNILHIAMLEELNRALDLAAADVSVRMLMLTGSGERFFSAGVDVLDHTPERAAEMLSAFHGSVRRLRNFPLPTLAVLNGSALGGGCELVLACDLALAVEDAQLGQPEIKLGVFAPVAAILLPRLLPAPRAMEMLLGGASLSAEEARHYGLLNRVFPRADFSDACRAFILPYLQHSRAALLENKQAIHLAAGKPFDEALATLEQRYLSELMATADAQEGIAAFLEKRAPQWRHR